MIAGLALLVCLPSCGYKFDTEEDPSLEEIISIGKGYLVEGNGAAASDAFNAALKIDDTSTDARFGAILADVMSFTNLIDELVTTLSSFGFGSTSAQTYAKAAAQTKPGFSDLLHQFLDDVLVGKISQSERLYAELAEEPDFRFDLDRYRISVMEIELVNLGGEFDKADLHMIGAVSAIMNGLLNFLLAHNIDIDIASLALPTVPEGADTLTTIDMYLAFLEDLLANPATPDLLTLDGPDGAAFMQQVGIDFGNAFERIDAALVQLAYERDQQIDDQLRFFDTDFDGIYNDGTDPVMIGDAITLDPELVWAIRVLASDLGAAFKDGSAADVDPSEPNPFHLSAANELLQYLGVLPIVLIEEPFTLAITEIPDFLTIDIGSFFADPDPQGIRQVLEDLIALWNDLSGLLMPEA